MITDLTEKIIIDNKNPIGKAFVKKNQDVIVYESFECPHCNLEEPHVYTDLDKHTYNIEGDKQIRKPISLDFVKYPGKKILNLYCPVKAKKEEEKEEGKRKEGSRYRVILGSSDRGEVKKSLEVGSNFYMVGTSYEVVKTLSNINGTSEIVCFYPEIGKTMQEGAKEIKVINGMSEAKIEYCEPTIEKEGGILINMCNKQENLSLEVILSLYKSYKFDWVRKKQKMLKKQDENFKKIFNVPLKITGAENDVNYLDSRILKIENEAEKFRIKQGLTNEVLELETRGKENLNEALNMLSTVSKTLVKGATVGAIAYFSTLAGIVAGCIYKGVNLLKTGKDIKSAIEDVRNYATSMNAALATRNSAESAMNSITFDSTEIESMTNWLQANGVTINYVGDEIQSFTAGGNTYTEISDFLNEGNCPNFNEWNDNWNNYQDFYAAQDTFNSAVTSYLASVTDYNNELKSVADEHCESGDCSTLEDLEVYQANIDASGARMFVNAGKTAAWGMVIYVGTKKVGIPVINKLRHGSFRSFLNKKQSTVIDYHKTKTEKDYLLTLDEYIEDKYEFNKFKEQIEKKQREIDDEEAKDKNVDLDAAAESSKKLDDLITRFENENIQRNNEYNKIYSSKVKKENQELLLNIRRELAQYYHMISMRVIDKDFDELKSKNNLINSVFNDYFKDSMKKIDELKEQIKLEINKDSNYKNNINKRLEEIRIKFKPSEENRKKILENKKKLEQKFDSEVKNYLLEEKKNILSQKQYKDYLISRVKNEGISQEKAVKELLESDDFVNYFDKLKQEYINENRPNLEESINKYENKFYNQELKEEIRNIEEEFIRTKLIKELKIFENKGNEIETLEKELIKNPNSKEIKQKIKSLKSELTIDLKGFKVDQIFSEEKSFEKKIIPKFYDLVESFEIEKIKDPEYALTDEFFEKVKENSDLIQPYLSFKYYIGEKDFMKKWKREYYNVFDGGKKVENPRKSEFLLELKELTKPKKSTASKKTTTPKNKEYDVVASSILNEEIKSKEFYNILKKYEDKLSNKLRDKNLINETEKVIDEIIERKKEIKSFNLSKKIKVINEGKLIKKEIDDLDLQIKNIIEQKKIQDSEKSKIQKLKIERDKEKIKLNQKIGKKNPEINAFLQEQLIINPMSISTEHYGHWPKEVIQKVTQIMLKYPKNINKIRKKLKNYFGGEEFKGFGQKIWKQ